MIGLVGLKKGMTRIFTEEGHSIPVTVIEVCPNTITQLKTVEAEGYCAVQSTRGEQKPQRLNKPLLGHYAKAGVAPGRGLWEFRVTPEVLAPLKVGQPLTLEIFTGIDAVDVIGTSKGKGFAGVVKRWNFRTQDMSHGNSLSHRAPGSIGQNQTPGRVFKGKKMAGHLGVDRVTAQNLKIVRIDSERHVLLVKGAVPGPRGGTVLIQPSIYARSS